MRECLQRLASEVIASRRHVLGDHEELLRRRPWGAYTDKVAAGLEDYYAGRGEAVGHWVGSSSPAAGLAQGLR